jgi:hypothetical protein
MKKDLPVIVLIVAILHFVGGGLSLLFDCVGAVSLASGGGTALIKKTGIPTTAPGQAEPVDMEALMRERVSSFTAFSIARLVFDTILSVMLIVAGIGLLKLQSWARSLSIAYALLSILFHLGEVAYNYAFLVPVTIEGIRLSYEGMPEPQRSQLLQMMPVMSAFMWFVPLFHLLYVIYPIIVLILLTRKRVVEAFAGRPDEMEAPPQTY